MKNAEFWLVKVDGVRHEVRAQDRGNSFDVYVDEGFRFNIKSDLNLNVEEDLTVGSKRCRFVVYEGIPDLSVDGILLNADAAIVRSEKRGKLLTLTGGIVMILVGLFAFYNWMALTAVGEAYFGGIFAPIFSLGFTGVGIWLVIQSRKKAAY